CNNDLGLEHLKIRDSSLTARSHSSYESLSHGECKAVEGYPSCARLNNNVCSWCVKGVGDQYLQVDFGNCTTVSGIETQGAEGCTKDYYVRKYKVSYRRDGQTWLFYPVSITTASIKGVSCQDKYKAVLLETFNVKVMLHAVLSIFLIFTSYHCDPRNEMNSEEFEEVVESSGSSP
ncbi:Lactadherin, partial [Acropora cervicornis]